MTEPVAILKTRTREWSSSKIKLTIQELSAVYFAKINDSRDLIKITFYSRPNVEYVCTWKFDRYFFKYELQDLFNKHNSVFTEERSNKQ